MDEALAASGLADPFHRLVDSLDSVDSEQLQGAALDHMCSQIRSMLEESPLPPTFLPTLSDALNLPASSSLIARSSANVEDLAGMSAAGLYDSIAGVTLANQVSRRERLPVQRLIHLSRCDAPIVVCKLSV